MSTPTETDSEVSFKPCNRVNSIHPENPDKQLKPGIATVMEDFQREISRILETQFRRMSDLEHSLQQSIIEQLNKDIKQKEKETSELVRQNKLTDIYCPDYRSNVMRIKDHQKSPDRNNLQNKEIQYLSASMTKNIDPSPETQTVTPEMNAELDKYSPETDRRT